MSISKVKDGDAEDSDQSQIEGIQINCQIFEDDGKDPKTGMDSGDGKSIPQISRGKLVAIKITKFIIFPKLYCDDTAYVENCQSFGL